MITISGKGFISCLISSNNRNLQLLSFQKIYTLLGVLWNVWPWSNDYARLSFGVYWYLKLHVITRGKFLKILWCCIGGEYCNVTNNYCMRLSMISWIIKTEVCRNQRLRQITQTRGFDNSWYHAKTEFNNCFIIHFSHNWSSETEAKRSAILFLRRTLQGA